MISRRDFLKGLGVIGVSQALFPSWMPKLAFAQSPSAGNRQVLVVIFQRGGMDGLNAVVPYGEGANYYDRRPTIAIREPNNGGYSVIDLNGFFGLHPALSPLKEVYDDNALHILHAVGSPDPTRSHFDAMEYMERGIPGDKMTSTGWISRHLQTASWQNASVFRAVGIGAMLPTSLRGEFSALALRSIADFHLEGKQEQLAGIQRTLSGLYSVEASGEMLSTHAQDVFRTVDMLQSFSLQNYQPANGAQYPESTFGRGLMQVAQLIRADVGLEVACIDIGGWDTHDEQGGAEGAMANLLADFAQSLNAFYSDLHDDMARVNVVTMSEFGRTTSENASRGTDHGRASVMFLMGGGASAGITADWRGLTPEALDDGDLAVTTDYRAVLSELLVKRLGNSALERIFPDYTWSDMGLLTPA